MFATNQGQWPQSSPGVLIGPFILLAVLTHTRTAALSIPLLIHTHTAAPSIPLPTHTRIATTLHQVKDNNLNPVWNPFTIKATQLNNGDPYRPLRLRVRYRCCDMGQLCSALEI